MKPRTTVLALVKHYLPGYKSGGPIRTLANLVEHLGDELRFVVLTRDRDSGDDAPYSGVAPGRPYRVGKADVIYLRPSALTSQAVRRTIRDVRPDVLYLNSFFAREFSMLPVLLRRLRLIPDLPIILAPRGEFSIGALRIRLARKRAFLNAANALQLHRDITWQASSPLEAADIRRCIATAEGSARGGSDPIVVAPDVLAPVASGPLTQPRRAKTPGRLRILFLSRLVRKKNLLGALRVLATVKGNTEFDIYGPIEDRRYWDACQQVIHRLPPNIRVQYRGIVDHAAVPAVMAEHDLLFFPTLGENYGHVVVEAFMAGCPVLLSDQTPWRDLAAAGVGWEFPLTATERFRAVIEDCIAMDAPRFRQWSERATAFGWQRAADPSVVAASRQLLCGINARRTEEDALMRGDHWRVRGSDD